jgi:hypothetical protein
MLGRNENSVFVSASLMHQFQDQTGLSQRHSLGEDAFTNIPVQGPFRADLDRCAQQILQVQHETGVVQERSAWLPLHQKIDVALLSGLASCDGPEDSHVRSTVPPGKVEDRVAFFLSEHAQCDHG